MSPSRRPRLRKALVALAALVVLVLVLLKLSGVLEDRIEPGPDRPAPTDALAPGERVVEVLAVDAPLVERFPGTVRSVREAVVAARITARVSEVSCRPGDRVAEGAELVVLDARDLEARAAAAREALAAAGAEAEDAASALARMTSVGASGSGAVRELELDAARARLVAAEANVEGARSQLEEARVAAGYARLTAPFDAVVVDRYVEPGDVATVGAPVVRLYDASRMRLEAFVRESLAVRLAPGDEVTVELAALEVEVPGTVEELVPMAEPGSRSLLVKVALPPQAELYPGLFGRVLLRSGTRTSLRVPSRAVHAVGQLRHVLLEDGTRRQIVLGREHGDEVEVTSGLDAGERVRVPGA